MKLTVELPIEMFDMYMLIQMMDDREYWACKPRSINQVIGWLVDDGINDYCTITGTQRKRKKRNKKCRTLPSTALTKNTDITPKN